MKEEWKDIEKYVGLYQISNLGRVKSFHGKKERILHPCGKAYLGVTLCKKENGKVVHSRREIHRLVATHFINNNENKPFTNHKNGNKHDNRVENLEWCTAKENTDHAISNRLLKVNGINNPMAKINKEIAVKIRSKYKTGKYSQQMLGNEFGLSQSHVGQIIKGNFWSD